jgi:phage terminase Nu1 subunit (DNA packaging protein)
MTLTIELSDELEAALEARAKAQGVSAVSYVLEVLERTLAQEARRPISTRIREIWSGMPDEVRARLPKDGASQVDHYVYGIPKRDQ